MSWKIARTFQVPATVFEQEVMDRIDATMEAATGFMGGLGEDAVVEQVGDADAVISVLEPFTRAVIERLPKCRIITNIGVGYQNIDVQAATDAGICAVNNP